MNPTIEEILRRLSVLAGTSDDTIRFLAGLVRTEHYQAGQTILEEGAPGDRVFFIARGSVKVVKAGAGGDPVMLVRMAAGDFFGEMSLVESVARSASVVAEEEVEAFTLKGADFYRLYRHQPQEYGIVMLNIARDLARRLRRLDEQFIH